MDYKTGVLRSVAKDESDNYTVELDGDVLAALAEEFRTVDDAEAMARKIVEDGQGRAVDVIDFLAEVDADVSSGGAEVSDV